MKSATLNEDTEKVLTFIDEFIKRNTTGKGRDKIIYTELSELDKENVNDVLKGFGIVYKDTF